jgi:hypothetical protein
MVQSLFNRLLEHGVELISNRTPAQRREKNGIGMKQRLHRYFTQQVFAATVRTPLLKHFKQLLYMEEELARLLASSDLQVYQKKNGKLK